VRERVLWADDPDGWEDDPDASEYDERPARAALRSLPSRLFRDGDPVVVLRCGAGRHQHPPRVGEVFGAALLVKRTYGPSLGRRRWVSITKDSGGRRRLRSVRFSCRDGCPADWNIDTARLEAAYRQAVASGRRTLVFGVDL
jgi:hypothetical protein